MTVTRRQLCDLLYIKQEMRRGCCEGNPRKTEVT